MSIGSALGRWTEPVNVLVFVPRPVRLPKP